MGVLTFTIFYGIIYSMRFLSFVEECIMNPAYEGYVGGRIEVMRDGPYAEEEIRFLTNRVPEFEAFREQWDFKDVTENELLQVKAIVKKGFLPHPLPNQEEEI